MAIAYAGLASSGNVEDDVFSETVAAVIEQFEA
jgi:hypothetical protein